MYDKKKKKKKKRMMMMMMMMIVSDVLSVPTQKLIQIHSE
jgi:accessory gene regulator protein AgrB